MWIRRGSDAPSTVSLTRQFVVTGGAVMFVAMIAAGLFVSEHATRTTIENTASATALLMDSFISPLAQPLAAEAVLPDSRRGELDRLLGGDLFRQRFPHLEIWKEGGVVAYSTTPELIGRQFAPPDGLTTALKGDISAQYANLDAREHTVRGWNTKYLEIYVPIREHHSGRVIAVAEIHENPLGLDRELRWLRLKSWVAVACATALIMLGLFGIVYRGNRLILSQQRQLRARLIDIEQSSRHNQVLKERAERASGRVAELTENYLRRIGAELHDGPAQLIGLAALAVEHVRRARTPDSREEELQALESVLSDALREIRTTSKGLMLPDIERLPLQEVVKRVVSHHELRTGTGVAVDCDDVSRPLAHALKICAYRFLQEGLNNAFRHAGGHGQAVSCRLNGDALTLAVEDEGRGPGNGPAAPEPGLGLVGLRDRVESLGGVFRLTRRAGGGTRIEMSVTITGDRHDPGEGHND
ncbi:sensor histidine kinase [Microvirga sesbaniae]|uniref:sensor histidine kinase n=1 Tax=Microvirga sesbaniae TaxID=681392 RepID=UPI0021CAB614|nr:sensor histidine kinase [Microvirga sp. HBU67692]